MALSKRIYVGGTTKITAANLNDIQDSIIALEDKGITKEEVTGALGYTPAKSTDIPTTDINANTATRHTHENKTVLDGITGIVDENNVLNPDRTTDLVNYAAFQVGSNMILQQVANSYAKKDDVPTSLKNPNALKFTGASTGIYDGSSEVTINIPSGGGSSSIAVDSALSSTSTNPVQNKVVNNAISIIKGDIGDINTIGNIDATVCDAIAVLNSELNKKLPLSGGTLTGNLTGKYITGTWLQTTAVTESGSAPSKIAVIDGSGLIYYRTFDHIKSDLGIRSLPIVTTSDNGKFLRVVNGAWTATEIPSAEGVNF